MIALMYSVSQHPEDDRLRPKHVGAYIERICNVCAFRCINTKQAHSAVSNVTPEDETEVQGSYSEPHLESVENNLHLFTSQAQALCGNILIFVVSISFYSRVQGHITVLGQRPPDQIKPQASGQSGNAGAHSPTFSCHLLVSLVLSFTP